MGDVLLLVDVLNDFAHEDGEALLASFRERQPSLRRALGTARDAEVPVVYANDTHGIWNGERKGLVARALDGRGGGLVAPIAPLDADVFVVKPRYSAFDLTPLELILRELDVERILLAGMATEMCVAQTAIGARELGFKVTVLADACASVDARNERIALEYLERVVGVFLASDERVPDGARR